MLLIDNSNTHNFIDQALVKKRLRCQMQARQGVTVSVANGDKLWTQGMCKGLRWEAQGFRQNIDSLSDL